MSDVQQLRDDLHYAPGGEAGFDPSRRACVLRALGDSERVWIKRPLAGAKAGFQVRFRLGSDKSPRLAVMLSFVRWLELRATGADIHRAASDGSIESKHHVAFESSVTSGTVTVVPRSPHMLVFLDDRLLFALPEADCPLAEGLQLGASGGAVFLTSVRVKDRTR